MLRWIAAGLFSISFLFISQSAHAIECNGKEYLCDRRFDQVVYPTAHNAHAYTRGKHKTFIIPDQVFPVSRQLEDGIRAFMIDIYYYKGEIYTCHALCWLGSAPLIDTLVMFKNFLDTHPNEVVSIIFESYVKAEDVAQVFLQAGLADRLFSQPQNTPWATLGEILAAKKNMVIFTEDHDSPLDWYHPIFSYAVETHFSVTYAKQFNCKFNRGNPSNSLFILNHFLTHAFFRKAWNRKPNQLANILHHADECFIETGKLPNFLTVDFYTTTGAVVDAAEVLNHLI